MTGSVTVKYCCFRRTGTNTTQGFIRRCETTKIDGDIGNEQNEFRSIFTDVILNIFSIADV